MKMPHHGFIDISTLNKASGDPLRLEVLRVLAQDAYGVLELCDIFDHKQSGMSHHLKVLAEAGLVHKRREGNSIFYSRAVPLVTSKMALLQLQLYATIDDVMLLESTAERVEQVKVNRGKASQAFFVQQGDRFKAQQDLIAEYPVYGEAVADLLEKSINSLNHRRCAIEIGPGLGEFLPVLSQHFEEVLAVDNAPAMLSQAEQHCVTQGIGNVSFIEGDTRVLAACNANCVVMNMVLHHTPSPADIIDDLSACLEKGGVLIITDLCRHDQDWAKTACGDVWLGFDADELVRWASSSGLVKQHSHYLALRNGFQIQCQQFKKS